MSMKKVAFHTLGCKVNQYETEAMIELFINADYEVVDYEDYADVYIINTCSVTNIGDSKSRQMIRKPLKINTEAIIVVVGCYSQVNPEKVMAIEGVMLVLGTNERKNIVNIVNKAIMDNTKTNYVSDIMTVNEFEELSIKGHDGHTRAFIKIQDGCDNYCTYCIIPYARGHIRSRNMENIITEVKRLTDNGFSEIVLTGIHIGSYGKENGEYSLIEVIENIHSIDRLKRIRLGSIEPNTLTSDFLERLQKLNKVCHQFHLSLQSGCDTVLKRMNRKYDTTIYEDGVNKLRQVFSDVAITTDIIVGFPGETTEEFEQTKNFVRHIGFSNIHIFPYSPKEGTPAARYSGQISNDIKHERAILLEEINKDLSRQFEEKFLGKTADVLFENEVKEQKNMYEGFSSNYIKVSTFSEKNIRGEILPVKLIKIDGNYVVGKI